VPVSNSAEAEQAEEDTDATEDDGYTGDDGYAGDDGKNSSDDDGGEMMDLGDCKEAEDVEMKGADDDAAPEPAPAAQDPVAMTIMAARSQAQALASSGATLKLTPASSGGPQTLAVTLTARGKRPAQAAADSSHALQASSQAAQTTLMTQQAALALISAKEAQVVSDFTRCSNGLTRCGRGPRSNLF
jgi:hypothetical protein